MRYWLLILALAGCVPAPPAIPIDYEPAPIIIIEPSPRHIPSPSLHRRRIIVAHELESIGRRIDQANKAVAKQATPKKGTK